MERLKRIARRIFYPPVWLAALLVIPSFALVIYVLASGQNEGWMAYLSYGLSAYALVVLCCYVPGVVRAFRTDFEAHPLVRRAVDSRMRTDWQYRQRMTLLAGLVMNLLYAAMKLFSGICWHSAWFAALAGYYLLLAVLRAMLLQHVRRGALETETVSGWKRYRLCGAVLLLMHQALAVMVFLVVRRGDGVEYPGLLIYAMAAYTFYSFTMAVIHMVRSRREKSPVLSALRAIALVEALTSMLSLETALLAQFGTPDQADFRALMTGATGAAVCAVVLAMAVFMVLHAGRQIQQIQGAMQK